MSPTIPEIVRSVLHARNDHLFLSDTEIDEIVPTLSGDVTREELVEVLHARISNYERRRNNLLQARGTGAQKRVLQAQGRI